MLPDVEPLVLPEVELPEVEPPMLPEVELPEVEPPMLPEVEPPMLPEVLEPPRRREPEVLEPPLCLPDLELPEVVMLPEVELPEVEPEVIEPEVEPLPPVEPVVVWACAVVANRPRPKRNAAVRNDEEICLFIRVGKRKKEVSQLLIGWRRQ